MQPFALPPPPASFVWRLHKHPLYLAHLPPSLSLALCIACLWVFPLTLSCLALFSSSTRFTQRSLRWFIFSQVFVSLPLCLHLLLSSPRLIFFSKAIYLHPSPLPPLVNLSLSSFCTFHSYLHGSSLLPSLHCHVSSPLCCAAGQFAVCQILMTCPLEFKVSLWLSCVTSTYSSHPFALWSSSRCFTEKGFPHVF